MRRYSVIYLLCTFPLVVKENRLVLLHDVGKEESRAWLVVWLDTEEQLGPEGFFEWEVPRGRDAVLP